MRFDGIDCIGEFKIERLSSLPGWTADDEGRVVYTEDMDRLYIGTNSVWRLMAKTTDDVDLTATAAEINLALDGITANATELNYLAGITTPITETSMPLFFDRPKFTWKDANEIYIGAGSYYHKGTTDQLVYWDSQLTTALSLVGVQWFYLYIDDSHIVGWGGPVLDESYLQWTAQEPTWSNAKYGWYHPTNTNDRCIFAVYNTSAGSTSIKKFYHDGGRYVDYDTQISNHNGTITSSWTPIYLTLPDFGDGAQAAVTFQGTIISRCLALSYRKYGSSNNVNHMALYIYYHNYFPVQTAIVTAGDSQRIEVRVYRDSSTLQLFTNGYFLPGGM